MWGWAIFFIICFFGLAYLYFDEKQNEAKKKVDRSKKEFENSIDLMVHSNLARKMLAMYEWLDDPNLSPLLGMFEPQISDEEWRLSKK